MYLDLLLSMQQRENKLESIALKRALLLLKPKNTRTQKVQNQINVKQLKKKLLVTKRHYQNKFKTKH